MAQRRTNMLEAFQASKNAPVQTAGTSAVRAKKASLAAGSEDPPLEAGGPFAAVPHDAEEAPSIELSVEGLAMQQKLRWLGIAIGAVACFGLGYLVGAPRNVLQVREVVAAAEPSEPDADDATAAESTGREASGRTAELADPPPITAGTAGEAPQESTHPIDDPRNRFTIQVATYNQSEANLERAFSLVDYLIERGYDAGATGKGARYHVVVGGAEKTGALKSILEGIRKEAGPPPQNRPGEFDDAYIVNISQIYDRPSD